MENITRTTYGSFLQTCQLLGLPFVMKANTTLNEKFGIQSGIQPDIAEMPRADYFVIGNGGHRLSVGGDGTAITQAIQHRAIDAALFKHLPFVLREPENDLTVPQRANYALRREEVHNSIRYIAYYAKRIPLAGVAPTMEYKHVENGVTTTTPFVPDSSNLNPAPPELSSTGVNVTTGDYTTTTAKLTLSLTVDDVNELLNVADVLFANRGYAIISEVGIVSGVDRVVQSPSVGTSMINFNEVIAAQIVSHMNTFLALEFSNNGVDIINDVGSTEPLFKLA